MRVRLQVLGGVQMVALAFSISLFRNRDFDDPDSFAGAGSAKTTPVRDIHPDVGLKVHPNFFRIPPFPGATARAFEQSFVAEPLGEGDADRLVRDLRARRVGGTYWAAQPVLPPEYFLVRCPMAAGEVEKVAAGLPVLTWFETPANSHSEAIAITGPCDPWHMLSGAKALIADPDDEVSLIAAIAGVPTYAPHSGDGALLLQDVPDSSRLLRAIGHEAMVSPYTGEVMSVWEVVELCAFWRSLIDSNRDLVGGLGFAFWKQGNVAPLLWGGGEPFEFLSADTSVPPERPVAVWRSKAPAEAISRLEKAGTPLVEVEDGFLRSQGLGADCVPPLSITVDRLGAYFDHSQPSELETLLQNGRFSGATLERARALRSVLVETGIGKYGAETHQIERPEGHRRLILVPGQVEDDRSVMTGGGGLTNLNLLKRVRAEAPDAFILYKPHPDVLAGHRKGAIADRVCLEFADQIVTEASVASLIGIVDEVHVNTSLTGCEALLRQKDVVTYGVPFYAGWGLTRDLGPVPKRRGAKRSLDELVAATLLVYPRYLDPVTGLPCPAEIVVDRLCDGATRKDGWIVKLRRLQGKIVRGFRCVFP